jgi:hypothetical protein
LEEASAGRNLETQGAGGAVQDPDLKVTDQPTSAVSSDGMAAEGPK